MKLFIFLISINIPQSIIRTKNCMESGTGSCIRVNATTQS